MAITEKRKTGDRGEEVVAKFLMKQGFKIVERNHWRKWGEIDIISKNIRDNLIHFVEVKSVFRNLSRGLDPAKDYSPADNMTKKKKERLARVVQTYVNENRLEESDWQVDVALVYLDTASDKHEIEILEDIDL